MTAYGIERVKEMYERHGGDPDAIAEELGIKPASASMLLRRYGLRPKNSSPRRKVTQEVLDEMIRRFKNGEPINAIARAMGLADSTVSWHLSHAGVYVVGTLKGRGRAHVDLSEEKMRRLLNEHGGNVAKATKAAQVSTPTFYRYMHRYGINPDEYRDPKVRWPRVKGLTTEQVIQAWEANGRLIRPAAKALGVSRNTVRHHLRQAGLVDAAQGA